MREIDDILAAWNKLRHEGGRAALATLCKVTGSASRRPGARMLIGHSMPGTGAISSGCLEADAFERARRTMESGVPVTITYDATRDDDKVWALNLGCKGVSEVLVEPLEPGRGAALHLQFIAEALEQRQTRAVALAFRVPAGGAIPLGARVLVGPAGVQTDQLPDERLVSRLRAEAQRAIECGENRTVRPGDPWGDAEFLIDVIRPRTSLVICGAGYDSVPLVELGRLMGWEVTLVDHRPLYAAAERWSGVARVIQARPEELAARVPLDRHSAAVVMTHHWENDLTYLRQLLASEARYIGLLSSANRVRELIRELEKQAGSIAPERLDRLHGPVGLDIGRGGPEHLALAIVAEIQASSTGASGRSMRVVKGIRHEGPACG